MQTTTTTTYLDRVLPAIDLVADRFVTMVTGAPDPTVRVPSTPAWTVRDVAAHLVTVTVRYAAGPEGRGVWTRTPMDLPGLNHDQLAALGIATVGELAARLRRELTALRAQVQGYGTDLPSYRFHGGERVRADIALGILLGELVVHGWDVARATGQAYEVDAASLEAVHGFVAQFSEPGQEEARAGLFGPVVEVPEDAPLLDRVIGLTGRDPASSPG